MVQAQVGPGGSRRLRLPAFSYTQHMKVARLSALSIGRLSSPGKIPALIYVRD
jgi:hypothetical protein